jgi:hypothetical protein
MAEVGWVDRAVDVFVVSEKNLPEAAFSKASKQVVTPNLRGMKKREGSLGILIGGVCVPG